MLFQVSNGKIEEKTKFNFLSFNEFDPHTPTKASASHHGDRTDSIDRPSLLSYNFPNILGIDAEFNKNATIFFDTLNLYRGGVINEVLYDVLDKFFHGR